MGVWESEMWDRRLKQEVDLSCVWKLRWTSSAESLEEFTTSLKRSAFEILPREATKGHQYWSMRQWKIRISQLKIKCNYLTLLLKTLLLPGLSVSFSNTQIPDQEGNTGSQEALLTCISSLSSLPSSQIGLLIPNSSTFFFKISLRFVIRFY